MRREERVTVQGPAKEQQPDGMSHRGRGGGANTPPPPTRISSWEKMKFPNDNIDWALGGAQPFALFGSRPPHPHPPPLSSALGGGGCPTRTIPPPPHTLSCEAGQRWSLPRPTPNLWGLQAPHVPRAGGQTIKRTCGGGGGTGDRPRALLKKPQPDGPHAHGTAARQGVDDHNAEGSGQRPSNDPPQPPAQPPVRQLLGAADAETAPQGTQHSKCCIEPPPLQRTPPMCITAPPV